MLGVKPGRLTLESRALEPILRKLREGWATAVGCQIDQTLLLAIFSGFGDMGLVAGFGYSLHERDAACWG